MPTIAVSNQKGGVGKTTLTVHLAAWLSTQGCRVLVADADPQANATSWLTDGQSCPSAFWELLIARSRPEHLLVPAKWGVGLLPGSDETGDAFITLAALHRPFDSVARMLENAARSLQPDFMLLDMPPSKAAGFRELLLAADYLLVPTQVERLSLHGVQYMADTVAELQREQGRAPRLLGVVPNFVRARTIDHGDHLVDLVESFGSLVWPAVPLSIRLSEAATYGATVWERDPACEAAKMLEEVCRRFVENVRGRQKPSAFSAQPSEGNEQRADSRQPAASRQQPIANS